MFHFTSFGESHGPAVGGVIEGGLSNIPINFCRIDEALRRRREGDGRDGGLPNLQAWLTPRKEPDTVEWLSGILDGKLLGTPIAFVVRNKNVVSSDYDQLSDCYRPGHADYTYQKRYGIRDWRGGGRASARETAARVIAGNIAIQMIETLLPIRIFTNYSTPLDALSEEDLAKKNTEKDSFGGIVTCTIQGIPAGIGDPISGKLNAQLAKAMMTIPSAVGFMMGDKDYSFEMTGAEYADQWAANANPHQITQTNHCGGIQGGISNGADIMFRVYFHAPTTQSSEMRCLNENGDIRTIMLPGRHDRCQIPRIPVIVESMAALTLAKYLL